MKIKLKIKTFILFLLIGILSRITIDVLAAREQGMDSKEIAAYDCSLGASIWPWSDVEGYTNASFVVGKNEIDNGFSAYTYIEAKSNDGSKTVESKTYVLIGTNYAHSNVVVEGYHSGCKSTHKIVYSAKGVSKTINLEV